MTTHPEFWKQVKKAEAKLERIRERNIAKAEKVRLGEIERKAKRNHNSLV